MNEVQEWGLQFIYDDNLVCRFRVMGLLNNIADDTNENFFPHYTEVMVDTGYNLMSIQIPDPIVNVLLNTQKETPIGKLVIVDGILVGVLPIRNMVTGAMLHVDQGSLFADSLQILGELVEGNGGVDVDENLL